MKELIKYDIGDKVRIRKPPIFGTSECTCVISMITVTKKDIKYRGKDCNKYDVQHNFPQEWIVED